MSVEDDYKKIYYHSYKIGLHENETEVYAFKDEEMTIRIRHTNPKGQEEEMGHRLLKEEAIKLAKSILEQLGDTNL